MTILPSLNVFFYIFANYFLVSLFSYLVFFFICFSFFDCFSFSSFTAFWYSCIALPPLLQTSSTNTPTHTWLGERGIWLSFKTSNMVKSSFEVCGISSSDPQKVRNGKFYKECMEKALGDLNNEDLGESEEDPFSCSFLDVVFL